MNDDGNDDSNKWVVYLNGPVVAITTPTRSSLIRYISSGENYDPEASQRGNQFEAWRLGIR